MDVRQVQLFLGIYYYKAAHDMRQLFDRPQPLCPCPVPCRSASRPPTSLASELNEHQPQQQRLQQQHRNESRGKDDCRKREGGCTTVRVPAAIRYVPVP